MDKTLFVVQNLIPWRDIPMSHAQQLPNRRYLDDYLQIIHRTGGALAGGVLSRSLSGLTFLCRWRRHHTIDIF
jgi:hypothetical protein